MNLNENYTYIIAIYCRDKTDTNWEDFWPHWRSASSKWAPQNGSHGSKSENFIEPPTQSVNNWGSFGHQMNHRLKKLPKSLSVPNEMQTVPFGHLWPDGRLRIFISIFNSREATWPHASMSLSPRGFSVRREPGFLWWAPLRLWGAIWTALENCSEKKFLRAFAFLAASSIHRQLRFVSSSLAVWLGPPAFNGPEST